MLVISHVSKDYESPQGPIAILSDASLALGHGESAAITGPSGSGKSTLLNLMGALDVPTSGEVRFEGQDVAALGEGARAPLRNHPTTVRTLPIASAAWDVDTPEDLQQAWSRFDNLDA